jgi:uncharacterized protein (TIGR02453 family)
MPDPDFAGFPRATFAWFSGLEEDNSKAWFAAHRPTYDADVRGALEALLEEQADHFEGRLKLFRQHRDTRFSHDKSPYKTTTYGVIAERPSSHAALYAQLSAEGLFAGTGYYVLATDQLARFRAAVLDDETGPELERVLEAVRAAGLETWGESLKTAPRGFPRDHPRVVLLRHKLLIAGLRLPADALHGIPREGALTFTRETWTACAPMVGWLDAHVGPSELPLPPSRSARGR